MDTPYPVSFDVERPVRFKRAHIVVRVLVLVILSALGGSLGSLFGLAYLAIPAISALLASRSGPDFLDRYGPRIARGLQWLVAAYAYVALLTDRFPVDRPEETARFEVASAGSPTAGSALARLLTSIPSALVLALLSLVAGIVWIVAVIGVLVSETYPASLYGFLRGVVRWQARLLAYHASLVDRYPPFSLETGRE